MPRRRVRESAERFTSQVLPPYRRRLEDVEKTLHELLIQGLSTRDFEPSLRALLGEATPLSPPTISRANKQFHDEYATWCERPIANEYVYLWADGVYLGAGCGERGKLDGGIRELAQTRPQRCPVLVADGAAGIWSAFGKVFPRARQRRCWLHKTRNVLDKVPELLKEEVQERLPAITHAETRVVAESLMERLARTLERDYAKATSCIRDDAERMLAYYSFPEKHRRHLRATNIIESNFDPVRSRTNICKRLHSGASATYLVYALFIRWSSRWRRFNGYAQLEEVHQRLTTRAVAIKKAA